MDAEIKAGIGKRLRAKREQAGYTRERLGELCSLSPRFIANIELGDSTFSMDTLMSVCRVLSCSSDEILFGCDRAEDIWSDTVSKIQNLDSRYQPEVDRIIRCFVEAVNKAEQTK